ncbi:hypothetical protein DFQ28_007636 [Apophysomyces sp. BC1034]|nr:hypothetical protein DFQ28_007636 [Apophysomyces sp. BC1034]
MARTLYKTLTEAFKASEPVASLFLRENPTPRLGRTLNGTDFERLCRNPLWRESFWEQFFNYDKCQRNRWRWNNEPANNPQNLALENAYYFETNGVGASVQFNCHRQERSPSSKQDFRLLLRNVDLGLWNKRISHLSKEPRELTEKRLAGSRIAVFDPGIRALFTSVDTNEPLNDRQLRAMRSSTVSNNEYQLRSMFSWKKHNELKSRRTAAIQQCYDRLTEHPPTVASVAEFSQYIKALSNIHQQ